MFEVIDRDVEQDGCTTWLRCSVCGQTERVYDQREDDDAQDAAERQHDCPPMCVSCGEPLDATDRACNVLACLGCRLDDPEGTEAAVSAHIARMTAAEMRVYLAGFWKMQGAA